MVSSRKKSPYVVHATPQVSLPRADGGPDPARARWAVGVPVGSGPGAERGGQGRHLPEKQPEEARAL